MTAAPPVIETASGCIECFKRSPMVMSGYDFLVQSVQAELELLQPNQDTGPPVFTPPPRGLPSARPSSAGQRACRLPRGSPWSGCACMGTGGLRARVHEHETGPRWPCQCKAEWLHAESFSYQIHRRATEPSSSIQREDWVHSGRCQQSLWSAGGKFECCNMCFISPAIVQFRHKFICFTSCAPHLASAYWQEADLGPNEYTAGHSPY